MSTLLKNIFISLLIVHLLGFCYVLSLSSFDTLSSTTLEKPLLIVSIYLVYDFLVSPILQTIIIGRLYGFKSLWIHLKILLLSIISVFVSWKIFFTIIELLTGRADAIVSFKNSFGMFFVTYIVQIAIFYLALNFKKK